jgi:type IV secretory pathway VirB4 component
VFVEGQPKSQPKAPTTYDFEITAIESKQHNIPQTPAMEQGILAKHPHTALFNGMSGSGKSTTMLNLLSKPQMYGGYFDVIYVLSGAPDSMWDEMAGTVDPENFVEDGWNEKLDEIFANQVKEIKEVGLDKAKRVLIVIEDGVNDKKFCSHHNKRLTKLFTKNRHYGITCWMTSQHINAVPKMCRTNATCVFFWTSEGGNMDTIINSYKPDYWTKEQFRAVIDHCTNHDQYSFMSIFRKQKGKKRFRRNLNRAVGRDYNGTTL